MDEKFKLLLLATIDEVLANDFGVGDLLTQEQSDKFLAKVAEVYEMNTPHELRESLIDLGRQLYAEIFERNDDE